MKTGPVPRTFEEILQVLGDNTIIDPNTGCRLWQGHTAGEGYGVISWQGKQTYIHRLIAQQIYGVSPEVIRHTCDRPNCWEPTHLRDGSHADNVKDKVEKDRHCYGTKHYKSKVTEDIVREIRASPLKPPELVKKYGLSRGAIHCILNRTTWKHVQ